VTGPFDVIVVGAGLSGLAAVTELRHLDPSLKILVLEATDHVGGRGYTYKMASGTPIDLGGAWVHGVPTNPLTSIVDHLGFSRVKTDLSTPFYTPAGKAPDAEQKEFAQALEKFEERVQAGALRARAAQLDKEAATAPPAKPAHAPVEHAREACQEHPKGDRASDYLPCGYEKYYDLIRGNAGPLESAAELENTSSVDTSEFASGEDDLVVQGLGNVVEAFGKKVLEPPVGLRLGARVTMVKYRDGGVSVTAVENDDQKTYEARRVLVTVSTGVLTQRPDDGGIAFDPPLPDRKRDAIAGLPMEVMDKIILEWDADVLPDDVHDNSWVLYEGNPPDAKKPKEVMAFVLKPFGSKRIAIGFFGGDRAKRFEARCQGDVDEKRFLPEDPTPQPCDAPAIDETKDALRKMFPKAPFDGHAPRAYVTRWGLVRWTRGAYSAALPDNWMMREELSRPVPFPTCLYEKEPHCDAPAPSEDEREKRLRVFFAGEGCARWIYNGSFPGAYESGLAAARQIGDSLAVELRKK
jgi:monoamine oxidase